VSDRASPVSVLARLRRQAFGFAGTAGDRFRGRVFLLGSAVLVGLVAGLGAILFYVTTRVVAHYALGVVVGYQPEPAPAGEPVLAWLAGSAETFRPWLLLLVPLGGGLLSGLLVFFLAPEAGGHGTDAVIAAYHHRHGYIRPRVPLVKIVASALTIGTGGSGGREGPIAQIGAGFGSFLAGLLRLGVVERRILMAAGMGAGVAAIFRAPLAGALFAAEVLYRSPEFEPEVIIHAGIASTIAYTTFGAVFGWKPLLAIPDLVFASPWELGPYLVLAVFMVGLASAYIRTFYGMTRLFRAARIPAYFKPAVGAALTGALGLGLYALFRGDARVLAVLSFGYNALQDAVSGGTTVAAGLLLVIALGKILTTSLTIGSGGSGGVFGPSMVIGGCGGGALGLILHQVWPELVPHPASFVVVGMAGFFAAAAKTPFSTLAIVSEMTGGYHLLLPTLWVCVLTYLLSGRQSIYASQLDSRSRSPAHRGDFVREILAGVRVGPLLPATADLPVLRETDPLEAVIERFSRSGWPVLPVVDAERRLLGVVNLEDVFLISEETAGSRSLFLATDLMRTDVDPLRPDDTLDRAHERFIRYDLMALPVVAGPGDRRVVGLARRQDVAGAYLRHVHGRAAAGAGEPSSTA